MKNKILVYIGIWIGFVFLLAVSSSAQDYNCPSGGMMYGFSGGYGYGIMLFSWITGLLIIIALVLAIIWLVKQITKEKKK